MIQERITANVLELALSRGADFAELYFENGSGVSISYNITVRDISQNRSRGVGLYLIKGKNSVYVYTNDFSEESLIKLCMRGTAMLQAQARDGIAPITFRQTPVAQPNQVLLPPSLVDYKDKIQVLKNVSDASFAMGSDVIGADLEYNDTYKDVLIANSEGVWAEDSKTTVRLRLTPTVTNGVSTGGYFTEVAKPCGFEEFRTGDYISSSTEIIKDIRGMLNAAETPNGHYPVILAPGGPSGTFFHECCGHQLETNYEPELQYDLLNNGLFYGKLGTKVASDIVTMVDDGTIPNMYGSSKYDDEGMPRQKNVLIENGVLKSYLVNRMGSIKMNVPRNASGRRQNYTQAPAARMSNTYLAPGKDTLEEMIRSTPEGLYVTRMGGGQGGADFTIVAHTAYWIKNGQIDHQVKNALLMGRGDETLLKIDRVGNDLLLESSGSYCGGASGLCNVTTSGASMRISEMHIGGKEGGK